MDILANNGHFGRKYRSFWWWTSCNFGHKFNGLAIQRSFSYWTAAILVITPKVGVELVIHQLVQFSVSFLPVSDLPLSNQPLS